jgi:probable HAF family extracellular repeat protein
MPRSRLIAVGVVVAALAAAPAEAAALEPAVLPALSGGTAFAAGVNNAGVIVGSSTNVDGVFRAVVWRNGRVEELGTLAGPDFGPGASSEAYAIDDQGRIVGESLGDDNRYHAVMWEEVTTTDRKGRRPRVSWKVTDLGTTGDGPWASANDVNAGGTIVGRYTIGQGFAAQFQGSRAFVWRDGAITTLDLEPGAIANAINDADQVVGTQGITLSSAGITGRAFLWQDGVGRDLGSLGGGASDAYSINNRGQVVGESNTADGRGAGFIWENGVMRRLPIDRPDLRTYVAASINDAGNVAGSAPVDSLHTRALFWSSPDAQPQTLAVPAGHTDASARTVGPQGWVLGYAIRLTSTSIAHSAVVWR